MPECEEIRPECARTFKELCVTLGRVDERMQGMDEKLDRLNGAVLGNGSPERGLIVRIDRVEQAADMNARRRMSTWAIFGILSAFAVSIAALVVSIVELTKG